MGSFRRSRFVGIALPEYQPYAAAPAVIFMNFSGLLPRRQRLSIVRNRVPIYFFAMKPKKCSLLVRFASLCLLPVLAVPSAFGWGKDGHQMINRLAAESLPPDMP